MFCSYCGNQISNDAKFCGKCGHATSDNKADTTSNLNTSDAIKPSKSFIEDLIYAKSRRRLKLGYGILSLAIFILAYQYNYIDNLITGPRTTSAESLEAEMLSGEIVDINVNLSPVPNSVFQTGYTYVTQTIDKYTNKVSSETTDQEYYLTIVGRHFLVLEGKPGQIPRGNFEGVVLPLSSELRSKLITDFNNIPEISELSGRILPYVLSDRGMTAIDSFWEFLLGIALMCWGGFLVFRGLTDPDDRRHYIYKVFSSAGYRDIDELSKDFVASSGGDSIKVGSYTLNKKFIFKEKYFSFEAYPLSQMYWAYKKVISRSVYFIPTGKAYEIVMNFKPNKTISIGEDEKEVNDHLVLLVHLCPDAKFGYTK